jgi:large subunit ribosomal protein L7/L12
MLRSNLAKLLQTSQIVSSSTRLAPSSHLCGMPLAESLVASLDLKRWYSSADTEIEKREINDPKILELADKIVALNLLEVSDLTTVLQQRLNIPDSALGGGGFPMMAMAAAAAPGGAAAPAADAAPAVEEKTAFDIKIESFDAASKIKVIKEVRAATDLGLKEAKELVEGVPAVVKKSLKKEEAEELKKKLEAAGAVITLA